MAKHGDYRIPRSWASRISHAFFQLRVIEQSMYTFHAMPRLASLAAVVNDLSFIVEEEERRYQAAIDRAIVDPTYVPPGGPASKIEEDTIVAPSWGPNFEE